MAGRMSIPPATNNPYIIEVIQCRLERRGSGKDETSPIRIITQFYTKDGKLLMENDPAATFFTPEKAEFMRERLLGLAAGSDPEYRKRVDEIIDHALHTR